MSNSSSLTEQRKDPVFSLSALQHAHCELFYSTDCCDATFNQGLFGVLCHGSMGSHSLDTKTTLSLSDITAISPAMLHLFACVCPPSLSEHTACIRHTLHYVVCFFWQPTGDKRRRLNSVCKRAKAQCANTSSSTAQPSSAMVESKIFSSDHPGEAEED